MLKILHQSLAGILRKWKPISLAPFAADRNLAIFPIDIV
jgi:hypothetical protein